MITEAELPDAVAALDKAVAALIGVQVLRDDQGVFTAPGLLTQLENATASRPRQPGGKTIYESQPAVWVDGLSLLMEIHRAVRKWSAPDIGRVQTLLDGLPRRKWCPQDAEFVQGIAAQIDVWAAQIGRMLTDYATTRSLPYACPAWIPTEFRECAAEKVYRHVDGAGDVSSPALTLHLSEDQKPLRVVCSACGAVWEQDLLLHLGAMLRAQREEASTV